MEVDTEGAEPDWQEQGEQVTSSSGSDSEADLEDEQHDQEPEATAAVPARTRADGSQHWKPSKRVRRTSPAHTALGTKRDASRQPQLADFPRQQRQTSSSRSGERHTVSDTAPPETIPSRDSDEDENSFVVAAKAERQRKRLKSDNGSGEASRGWNGKPSQTDSLNSSDAVEGQRRTRKRSKRHEHGPPRSSVALNFTLQSAGLASADQQSLVQAESLRIQANSLYRERRFRDALAMYTAALRAHPDDLEDFSPASILTNRAAAYMSVGDYASALEDMQNALSYPSSDPSDDLKRLTRLGRCYLGLGRVSTADVQQILVYMDEKRKFLNEDRHKSLSQEVARTSRDLDLAQRAFARLERNREASQWSQVLDDLQTLESLRGRRSGELPLEWVLMRAEAMSMLGNVDAAHDLIRPWLRTVRPDDPAALWLLGMIAYGRGDLAEATRLLDQLIVAGQAPIQADQLLRRAETATRNLKSSRQAQAAARHSTAIAFVSELLRQTSAKDPLDAASRALAFLTRAEAYSKVNDLDSALTDINSALAPEGQQPLPRFRGLVLRARIFLRLGRTPSATRDVLLALESPSSNIPAQELIEAKALLKEIRTPRHQDERRWRDGASHHEVLGVSASATTAEIRSAYKRESLQHHPDKSGGDAERFKRVNQAYTALVAASARAGRAAG